MKWLDTQAEFEALWFQGEEEKEKEKEKEKQVKEWIVYFTAAWCGPCKKLDCDILDRTAAEKGIPIFKCDVVRNEYTHGYCGVRAFPTFMFFRPKAVVSKLQSSDTDQVRQWIMSL